MSELGRTVRRLRRAAARRQAFPGSEPLRLPPDTPGCGYGAVTRRAVEDLTRVVERIELKLNTLLFGALVSVLLEIWRTANR
jgi:hypothetical protein